MCEGAMAAWATPAADAEAVIARLGLQDKVCVSCQNTATGVTLSGEKAAIEQMVKHGKETEVRCTVLPITRAYHSPHVDAVKEKFMGMTSSMKSSAPEDRNPLFLVHKHSAKEILEPSSSRRVFSVSCQSL